MNDLRQKIARVKAAADERYAACAKTAKRRGFTHEERAQELAEGIEVATLNVGLADLLAILAALPDRGWRLVPDEPSPQQLADAIMAVLGMSDDITPADYRLAQQVAFLLPPTKHPDAVIVVRDIARDYRAMLAAAPTEPTLDTIEGAGPGDDGAGG